MKTWVEENESLMHRLGKKGMPHLELIEEKICIHTDQEINHNNVEGNLRKIYLKSHENIVFAESFLVIK